MGRSLTFLEYSHTGDECDRRTYAWCKLAATYDQHHEKLHLAAVFCSSYHVCSRTERGSSWGKRRRGYPPATSHTQVAPHTWYTRVFSRNLVTYPLDTPSEQGLEGALSRRCIHQVVALP